MTADPTRLYRLEDLGRWDADGPSLAVLGSPVAHSVSPAMHNAALQAMAQTQGIFANWRYFKFEVAPEALGEALPRFWACGFLGLNLTIPHKVLAVGLVAAIDPEARLMGAVNTLRRLPGGGYHGYNTDGYGLEQALRVSLGVGLAGTQVLLLGAGGAARAAAVACLKAGCRRLRIANRSAERLAPLLGELEGLAPTGCLEGAVLAEGSIRPLPGAPWSEAPATPAAPWLVINATAIGLREDDPSPLDLSVLPAGSSIYDMTYGADNGLVRAARAHGMAVADGLPMLVWQGARSLEIWSGTEVPVDPMMQAACHARPETLTARRRLGQ